MMKLVDELIITNRWDADSKHKSQYSGIQYYKSYRHNVSLSGYLVYDKLCLDFIAELKKGTFLCFMQLNVVFIRNTAWSPK